MHDYDEFIVASLVEDGLLKPEGLSRALQHAAEQHVPKSAALVALGLVSHRNVAIARATIYECPYVELKDYDVDIRNAELLPRTVADRFVAFPLFNLGKFVTVAMEDPLDLKAVDQLRALLKAEVEPVLCEPEALRALINRAYSLAGGGVVAEAAPTTPGSGFTTGDEPIVAAINHIIAQAVDQGASDIHLGPDEHELHLRYRIDGALQARQGPPLAAHSSLVQRLKVMANLDLTQTRRPQDGKFRFSHGTRAVDVRLSVIPTVCGENAVMRLLTPTSAIKGFSELGFPADATAAFEHAVEAPYGMILATGPTGSGKTTTLYTALKRLNTPDRNLMTIEDPVEIRLPMVRHVQVNTEIGMTFAGALRSILRQDPNVVLVGEIRDQETARIAVQAALTGHMVLSTLHTNDAPGAVARLAEFGCPPFAINASLLCIIAQRLVKRVCPDCTAPDQPSPLLMARFRLRPGEGTFVKGAGCARCASRGYRGRIGVYEMLRMTPALQQAVERSASTAAVREVAMRDGLRPMWMDGLEKARIGMTTLEEVVRVIAVELADTSRDGEAVEEASRPAGAEVPVRLSA